MVQFKKVILDWKLANFKQPVESVPGISLWRKKQTLLLLKDFREKSYISEKICYNQKLNADTDKF